MRIEGVETPVQGAGTDPRPALPPARGPLSEALFRALLDPAGTPVVAGELASIAADGVLGEDSQLTLYSLYELHYRGFRGVDENWEWQPALIALRAAIEADFEVTLRERALEAEPIVDPGSVGKSIMKLVADDGAELSPYMERSATLEQFREFLIHRSAYQLKEADPH